ncbi:MAG: hypothetical protein A2107_03385 [Verrucomicrobia bacterium GWF2_62_7]|nr:MAG: hypothetical protein A2107_03385 [Verrucomicrobia bacterium GWF2_62_7]
MFRKLCCHNQSFVSNTAFCSIGFILVFRRADKQDTLCFPDAPLHEKIEIRSIFAFPLIKYCDYTIVPKIRGEFSDPCFMIVVLMRIGDENLRRCWST